MTTLDAESPSAQLTGRSSVPEMNNGMLSKMLRSEFLVDAEGVNKIAGQPFKISEIAAAIDDALENL